MDQRQQQLIRVCILMIDKPLTKLYPNKPDLFVLR